MKVVICTRHGGFGLSIPALKRLADESPELFEKMPKVEDYFSDNDIPMYRPFADDPELMEYAASYGSQKGQFREGDLFHTVSYKGRILSDCHWRYEERAEPTLVRIVEEMGEAADGRFAALKIVEIPDDVQWHIEEYDGKEWVSENHETWA